MPTFAWDDVSFGKVADPDTMNALGRTVAQHDAILQGGFPIWVDQSAGAYVTGSTSYLNTGLGGTPNPLTLAFKAAKSTHTIEVSCVTINGGASGPFNQLMSFSISGGMTYGPNDMDAAQGQFTNGLVGGMTSRRTPVAGFVAGQDYLITAQFRCTGSSGNWTRCRIIVE